MKNAEPHKMVELLKIKFERLDGKEYKISVEINEGYTTTAKEVTEMILDCLDPSRFFREQEKPKRKK